MFNQTSSESPTTLTPDLIDDWSECSAIWDAFEAHQNATAGSNSTASSSESSASPSHPLKRTHDAIDDRSSVQELSLASDFPTPDRGISSSPAKRRKCEAETETLDSTSESARPTKKQVRFHPSAVDNWLWIDLLNMGKLGVPTLSPKSTTPEDTADAPEVLAESGQGQSSTAPKASPSISTGFASPFSFANFINPARSVTPAGPSCPAESAEPAGHAGPTSLTSSTTPTATPIILVSPTTPSSSSRSQLRHSGAASLPRVRKLSRREISFFRAREFLENQSWSSSRFHDRDNDRAGNDDPDAESSFCTQLDDDYVWPQGDCDDVSAPTSSPPPSIRIMAMDVGASEANCLQAEMDAKKQEDASKAIPSIYPPSLHVATKDDDPLDESDKEELEPGPSPVQKEFKTNIRFLKRMFKRLPAEDAQKATESLAKIIGHVGQFYFERGFLECTARIQLQRRTQNPELVPAP